MWQPYKVWCRDSGRLVWTTQQVSDFSFDVATQQLAEFLSYLATSGKVGSSGTLGNYRSAVNTAFMTVFNCQSLAESARVARAFRGFKSTNPSQPRWADDETWDPGLLIQYWADKPDNHLLSTAQLARKSWCLFAVACWPRCSDGARVVRSTILFNQRSDVKFQFIGTKELNSIPVLTDKIGISAGSVPKLCPARALKAYLDRSKDFDHHDRVWCVTKSYGGVYHEVDHKGDTLRRWLKDLMLEVGIDPRFTGGSIRQAASSKAIDDGWEPAAVLQVGRWKSYAMWNRFYNRSVLKHQPGPTALNIR